jgi:hypothetical protein
LVGDMPAGDGENDNLFTVQAKAIETCLEANKIANRLRKLPKLSESWAV